MVAGARPEGLVESAAPEPAPLGAPRPSFVVVDLGALCRRGRAPAARGGARMELPTQSYWVRRLVRAWRHVAMLRLQQA